MPPGMHERPAVAAFVHATERAPAQDAVVRRSEASSVLTSSAGVRAHVSPFTGSSGTARQSPRRETTTCFTSLFPALARTSRETEARGGAVP